MLIVTVSLFVAGRALLAPTPNESAAARTINPEMRLTKFTLDGHTDLSQ
jgi:hypothetical protein